MKLGLELMSVVAVTIWLTDRRQDKVRHLVSERISAPVDFHSL